MKDMLCEISHAIADMAHEHLGSLDEINTCEMESVTKMLKNLEEAIYYHTIVEAMEDGKDVSHITINTETKGTMTK